MLFVGFDPGGFRSFGWAVLRAAADEGDFALIASGVVSNASEAIEEVQSHLSHEPEAVGIDSPLFWGRRGDRLADVRIRKLVCSLGGKSGTVSHVNSLRGACLIAGAMAAAEAAAHWPEALITETHPKALLRVDPATARFLKSHRRDQMTEHERDALIGAYSSWSALTRQPGWRDLVQEEFEPIFPLALNVSYWFPLTEQVLLDRPSAHPRRDAP